MKIAFFEEYFKKTDNPGKIITSGIDWFRIVNPAQNLKLTTDWEIDIYKDPFTTTSKFRNWEEICAYYDIGYFPYFPNIRLYSYLLGQVEKRKMRFVIDIDDNLWETTPTHRLFPYIHIGTNLYHIYYYIARTAPFLTTTNSILKTKLKRISLDKRIEILPNYIDLKKYYYTPVWNKRNFTIVYFGTNNHLQDITYRPFLNAIIRFVKKYPHIIFKTVGMSKVPILVSKLKQNYLAIKGNDDYYEYLDIWRKKIASAEIAVAPLENTGFSRCKSPLKFYETGAGRLPFICSRIQPYKGVVQQGKTGFLCRTEKDWYSALEALIQSEELRLKISNQAFEYVKENCTIQKNIGRYKKYFEKVYNTGRVKK